MSSFGNTRQLDEMRRARIRERRALEIACFQSHHNVIDIPLERFDKWLTEKEQGKLPRALIDAEEDEIVRIAQERDAKKTHERQALEAGRAAERQTRVAGFFDALLFSPIRAVRRLFKTIEERTRPE